MIKTILNHLELESFQDKEWKWIDKIFVQIEVKSWHLFIVKKTAMQRLFLWSHNSSALTQSNLFNTFDHLKIFPKNEVLHSIQQIFLPSIESACF